MRWPHVFGVINKIIRERARTASADHNGLLSLRKQNVFTRILDARANVANWR
jgi:hypothetical protein